MTWFLLGIFVMSCFATIAIHFIDDKKEKIGGIFLGPAFWVFLVCIICAQWIINFVRYHNLRALIVSKDGELLAVRTWAADAYRLVKDFDFPYYMSKDENKKKIAQELDERANEWRKEYRQNGHPNKRYSPKSVWKGIKQPSIFEQIGILKQSKNY